MGAQDLQYCQPLEWQARHRHSRLPSCPGPNASKRPQEPKVMAEMKQRFPARHGFTPLSLDQRAQLQKA